jgi:hypothetical protein
VICLNVGEERILSTGWYPQFEFVRKKYGMPSLGKKS